MVTLPSGAGVSGVPLRRTRAPDSLYSEGGTHLFFPSHSGRQTPAGESVCVCGDVTPKRCRPWGAPEHHPDLWSVQNLVQARTRAQTGLHDISRTAWSGQCPLPSPPHWHCQIQPGNTRTGMMKRGQTHLPPWGPRIGLAEFLASLAEGMHQCPHHCAVLAGHPTKTFHPTVDPIHLPGLHLPVARPEPPQNGWPPPGMCWLCSATPG